MFGNTPSLCNYPNMTIKFVRFRAVTNKLLGCYFNMLIMRTACSPHTCNNRFLPLCRYQYSIHFPRIKKKKLSEMTICYKESWKLWYLIYIWKIIIVLLTSFILTNKIYNMSKKGHKSNNFSFPNVYRL